MDSYEEKIEKLDTELDKIFDELKEVFKKMIFKSMIYRDCCMEMNRELLEKSLPKEMKEMLNEKK